MLSLNSFTGGIAQTNAYFIHDESSGSGLLIDAPEGVSQWEPLAASPPEALLLTHAHFDHIWDAAAVQESFDCPIYAFSPYEPSLTLSDLLPAFGVSHMIPPYEVTTVLEGETTLSLANWEFGLHHVPGHSPDSLCFSLASEKLLFGGDVLMRRSVGRTDFPHSDPEALVRGILETLFLLPGKTKVLPGHGPSTTIGEEKAENPFLTRLR